LVYCRRTVPGNVIDALSGLEAEVRIYGLGAAPALGNLRFFEVSEANFIRDMASARCIVGSAGNQLIGEALYLGKPIFALPEHGQYEQEVNGHLLQRMGGGTFLEPQQLRRHHLLAFLEALPNYVGRVDREWAAGNQRAVEAIEAQLDAPRASRSV
jgi:uncharacterized protein (TIGR00661 family)